MGGLYMGMPDLERRQFSGPIDQYFHGEKISVARDGRLADK
jgi:hypothetical protein